MAVEIKSYNQRLGLMARKILADTGLSDLRVGSVISSILEAAAQSDFEIEASIVEMLKLFNIDTTEGADLDRKALEFNIRRYTAAPSTDSVKVSDTSFTKKSSKIYIGLPPAVVGDGVVHVEDASNFPSSGQIYIGRGTGNYEGPLAYTSITNNTSYWSINLSSPVTKNHTSAEIVTLSQGGNRIVSAGTTVLSPANNFSPSVLFSVTRSVTLVDGETELEGVPVIAVTPGTVGNVPAGSIRLFSSPPFLGASVTNPTAFTNGRDVELDSDLRVRIRNAIQLVARGTKRSILQAVNGVSDPVENKRVVSAALTEPTSTNVPAQLYIDDGTGFEPSFAGQGVERIVDEAAGSEQFIQVSQFPVTPPTLVSSIDQPYGVQPGQSLTIRVDGSQETIVFQSSDFKVPGQVKASELVNAINSKSKLVVARSVRNKVSLALVAKRFSDGTDPEELQVLSGEANSSLKFPITISRVMSLYKNGNLLQKNPASAVVFSGFHTAWTFGVSSVAARLVIAVDNTPAQDVTIKDSDFSQFGTTYKTGTPEQWASVLTSKLSGITVSVESEQLRFASNKQNSISSKLQIQLAANLGERSVTSAVWQSGTTVRYSGMTITDGILVGDVVSVSGFSSANNNGIFEVTRVATNDYIELTTTRTDSSEDELAVAAAKVNPSKEDLALVFFGAAQESVGSSFDYKLNRFSGEIELVDKLSEGDNLTAGSEYTKARVDSIKTPDGKYNFPTQYDVSPAVYVAFDANSAKRTILIAIGDTLTQGRVGMTADVELTSNRFNAFASVNVGDYVFIVTRSASGSGLGYNPWFPSYATGLYEVTSKISNTSIYIKNTDSSIPMLPSVDTGIVTELEDVQAFSTDGLIQKIPLTGANLLPSAVVSQVNSAIQFGKALVFNNKLIRLQSNSFKESTSKVFILATSGTGKNVFTAGQSGTAAQPHIGFQVADVEHTSFPRLKDNFSGFLDNTVARGYIFGSATSSDIVSPYSHTDSTKNFLSDIKIDDVVKYLSGINNQNMLGIRSIESGTELVPQAYSTALRPIYEGEKYQIAESHKFSPYDKLIIELDQDSTNKTFSIPMYRTGRVFGIATSTTLDAYDADAAAGTDFNNSIWRDFSFQDFALMFRARNVYKSSAPDSALIIRSALFGEVGEKLRFSISYPTVASQPARVIHKVFDDYTSVEFFLSSGPARSGISNVGSGFKVSRSGTTLSIVWAGVGASPNFSGNGVVVGDIASVSDSAFAIKSSSFTGSGKVTLVTANSIDINLSDVVSLSTSYGTTAAADSGGGTTVTYAVSDTGLIQSGDKVEISGFNRSVNNGIFEVVGVVANTSIIVSNSNRTIITQATSGFRRTSNTVSLQFAGSIAGQLFVGDSIVVSGMAQPTLNGTFTVSSITTTVFANDTIVFTAAGIDLPVARTTTAAIWQSGNTVRYTVPNTGGIAVGNTVDIAGFSSGLNNGSFLVTNLSTNNWIEVTSTRTDGTNDQSGVVGATARPTYYSTDTGGTVTVINNESAAGSIDLIITQATSLGIASFPLAGTTAADVVSTIMSDANVNKVISAVNTTGYLGTGTITTSTADEPSSVGYGHSVGSPYISLYDGSNFVLDFYSAAVNLNKNFTLKKPILFTHPDYDISTAPNIPGEDLGEYFKLVPTTHRNIDAWFNKSNITSFQILGNANVTADGGKLQLSSQLIGTAGAVKISGGSANGIKSFLKAPSSVDSSAIRLQVNRSDMGMFTVGQVVEVTNSVPSIKPKRFLENNLIDVENVNGTTGKFKSRNRAITLATSNSVTITDVSASYGRSSGIVWRWTASGIPAAPFSDTEVGDMLYARNSNLNSLNQTELLSGNGVSSFFPIVKVDEDGMWIEVHNPNGVAEGPIALTGSLDVAVSPSFFIEWKHRLSVGSTMKVESLQFRGLMKFSWISGGSSPEFSNNGVCVEDYVVISGNTFLPVNRGAFRVVAVDSDYFVVENINGQEEAAVTVDLAEDVRFFNSESAIVGDKLNVSDLPFLEPNRGTHPITNYGTDPSLFTQFVTVTITNSSTQLGVQLTGLPSTFFVTDGSVYYSYKQVANFAVDPADSQSSILYLHPATNAHKMSNAYNTSIAPTQKFEFPSDVAIGVDGYKYFTGLLATVQKTVDGYDPDPINYPGYKAAGTQIEIVPPLVKAITVNVVVKPRGGINLSALSDSIKASILNYVNGLGVGDDVIISEITAAVMSVEGVQSATLFDPSPTEERIVVQDNEKTVISIDNITVSSG